MEQTLSRTGEKRPLNLAFAVGLTLLGAAMAAPCAMAQDEPAPQPQEQAAPPKDANSPGYVLEQNPSRLPETTNQCIFFRTLYDWKPLNNTNLIVWAPNRNSPYHIQLDRPCSGLKFAYSIGFTSRDSRLCGFGGDSVLVESGGGRADRCPIGSITKLTDESLKSLLAQAPGRRNRSKDEPKSDEKK